VDGQPLGLELDALPLSRLRRMFAEGIEELVDLDKRRDDLRAAFVDLLACELLTPDFDAQRVALQEAVKSSGLWDVIAGTALPDDVFSLAAVAGWGAVDPVTTTIRGNPLFTCADEVREAMRETLAQRPT
jgi:hypothetical protein